MSSNTTNQTNNIYPKSCSYGCITQIYWNLEKNEYWEVFSQKKHICPNRVNKPPVTNTLTGQTMVRFMGHKEIEILKQVC